MGARTMTALLALAACSRGNAPTPQQPAARPPSTVLEWPEGGCLAPGPRESSWRKPEISGKRGSPADWGAIGGHVSDGKKPLPGIQIVVTRDSRWIAAPLTDEWGVFRVEGLQPGEYELTLRYGESMAARKLITVTAGHSTVDEEVLELGRLRRVPRCA
jgi:hypothetical protein